MSGTKFDALTISTKAASLRIADRHANKRIFEAGQELPVTLPKRGLDLSGLNTRNVNSSPLDDWFLALPPKIPPKQIDSILRMAAAGNLWNQYQLSRRMEEGWPIYKKCCFELRTAISSAKYVVHPYTTSGKAPTKKAIEKADLVQRAIDGFRPDRFADEDGFNGMLFDLTDALINGIAITEMIWDQDATDPDGDNESIIRASAWVNPRNIGFTADGRFGVADVAQSGNMSFSNLTRGTLMDDPDKFLVAKFKSKSGSPLTAGYVRTLAPIWVMIAYGRDYALNFAQKYGNPFMDISYEPGMTGSEFELKTLENLARMAANQGYFIHPNTAKLEQIAEHKMGGDNAQIALMNLADIQCQILMLGQTLTTSTPEKGGTRAQGEVHENVRQERLEEHTKWIGRVLSEQFADSICRVNYRNDYLRNPERPTVEADLTRPMSATEQADYVQKLSNSTIALLADEVYKRAGMQKPQPGDEALTRGELIIVEKPMTPTEKKLKEMDMEFEQQQAMGGLESWKPEGITARGVQKLLIEATQEERSEIEQLVTAAERSPHRNGEIKAVELKIQQLITKKRL